MGDLKAVSWKEFKVRDIFPPINIKKYAKKPESVGNVPFISCQTTNNGIASYCGEIPEVQHCITVSTNGNCFDCFYHDYPIIPSSDVEVLSKDGITDNKGIALYLCAVLAPNHKLYSYSHKPKNGKVFDTNIVLPTKDDGTPDWEYMAERIKELESERIKELEAYLLATGLEDYELTEEDKQVLAEQPQLKEFKIGELFDVINNPQLDKENFVFSDNALYPYFTRTENNNGVFGYVEYLDDEHKIKGNSLAVGMISMKFHYMSHDFYAGQFTKTLIPKFKSFNETLALFFVSILNKYSSYYQGYLVREFVPRVKNTVCNLPVGKDGQPNWDYMEHYIRVMEKLVIADTVKWKDKMIEVTKSVVA